LENIGKGPAHALRALVVTPCTSNPKQNLWCFSGGYEILHGSNRYRHNAAISPFQTKALKHLFHSHKK
jgi:hypothetical protein